MSICSIYGRRLDSDAAGGGIFDADAIEVSNQFWFTGADASAWGNSGQVMACKAGERFFWNGKLNTGGGYNTPVMLSALPDTNGFYDTSVTIGAGIAADDDGSYTATADGAIFFPALWQTGTQMEGYIANEYTYLGEGMWYIQRGAKIDPFYLVNYPVNHVFNSNPSLFDLAGMLKNYIPMIGKKVGVLGDSLLEHSEMIGRTSDAYGFRTGTYNGDGWFTRIARKYNMDYKVHGYGMQWWYVTNDRPNGGVKAVNSLIESGYNPDYVILEYGTNDIWSGSLGASMDTADAAATSTVGAMRYCIETLQAQLPSAKILVIMPCMRNGRDNDAYYELVGPILNEYGVARVNMAYESGIVASMMNSDGVHLALSDNGYDNTTEAVARYSRCVESAMLRM